MDSKFKQGNVECSDCNTCGKCDELEQAQEMQGFNDAVRAAAAIERDSFEKNLARQRKATLAQDTAPGSQKETFSRNAVARPAMPAREGALLSHDGLTLYTLIPMALIAVFGYFFGEAIEKRYAKMQKAFATNLG